MFQRFTGLGHLTRSPELRYTTNGTPLVNGSVAFNRKFKQGEELKEEVCFLDFVIFGKPAESFAQYCTKGDGVLLDGRLQQRRWETEEGTKHSKHELVAETWRKIPRRTAHEEGSGEEA